MFDRLAPDSHQLRNRRAARRRFGDDRHQIEHFRPLERPFVFLGRTSKFFHLDDGPHLRRSTVRAGRGRRRRSMTFQRFFFDQLTRRRHHVETNLNQILDAQRLETKFVVGTFAIIPFAFDEQRFQRHVAPRRTLNRLLRRQFPRRSFVRWRRFHHQTRQTAIMLNVGRPVGPSVGRSNFVDAHRRLTRKLRTQPRRSRHFLLVKCQKERTTRCSVAKKPIQRLFHVIDRGRNFLSVFIEHFSTKLFLHVVGRQHRFLRDFHRRLRPRTLLLFLLQIANAFVALLFNN